MICAGVAIVSGQDQQFKEILKLQRFAGRPTVAELLPAAICRNKPQRNDAIVKAHLGHGSRPYS